jgi:hypothetical protein
LRQAGPPAATRIGSTSPFDRETGVSVTRETIVRFSRPLAAETHLINERLYAEHGGRRLLSRVELSSDRRTATLFYLEQLPSSARIQVTFDGTELRDELGLPLDADGDGLTGGVLRMSFTTGGSSALPGTAVVGHVYASERLSDGRNRPLSGVIVTVDGAEETLRAVTDAEGYFRLEPAPAGRFFVHVDGRPAVGSQWPTGGYYPFVGKAWEAVAGREDNLAGGTGEIYLPYIAAEALQTVSPVETTIITFAPSVLQANPALAGVFLEVPPNALFSDQGTRGGRVGIAPVPPDRLPEPLPPGLNLPLVITIQTDGAQNFDPPVPVRFPNLADPVTGIRLGPGAKTVLWSFNHDTGRWEPQGLATVTPDGQHAVTDPGVGVRQPGWHGVAPGSEGQGPEGDGSDGPDCGAYPPSCCESWDKRREPCQPLQDLALNGIMDLALDDVLFALGGPGGCSFGVAAGTMRAARDCAIVGQFSDACGGIVQGAAIGTGIGCIPGVGGALGLAWGIKSAIDSAVDYKACLDTVVAQCAGATPRTLGRLAAANQGDPRLRRAMAALDAQVRLINAVKEALTRILGSSRWAGAESPEGHVVHQAFMTAVFDSLSATGPGGAQVTAEERTAILALPRPNGASQAEASALLNRLEGFATGQLRTDSALRAEVAAGFDLLVKAIETVQADGWTGYFDGIHRAMAEIMSMHQPRSGSSFSVAGSRALLATTSPAANAASPARGFAAGPLHFVLRDLETGFVTRGQLTAAGRFSGVFLRPGTFYSVAYAEPETLQFGATVFRSSAAGETTVIPTAPLLASGSSAAGSPLLDADEDGLADLLEEILGTNPRDADTDGDGASDGEEVRLGMDPLDGVGLRTGVVGTAPTPGTVLDLVAENGLLLAACQNGLVVFDVSDPRNPIQTLVVPGSTGAVAMRNSLGLAAMQNGLHLVDLSDRNSPIVRWVRGDLGSAAAVAIGPDSAYAAFGSRLRRLDLGTGIDTGDAVMSPYSISRMAVMGERVLALGSGRLVTGTFRDTLEVSSAATIPVPGSVGGFEMINDLLYAQQLGGFTVMDLTLPWAPRVVADVQPGQATGWRHLLPLENGQALAVVAATGTGPFDVSLYQLQPGGTNAQFLTTFPTPGQARMVDVAGGMAYVADGASGLTVLSFLPPDLAGQPPTVALRSFGQGVDGRVVEAGSLARLEARVADDVGVRHVEFFVDGRRVARTDRRPYAHYHRVPPFEPGGLNRFTVRLRAVDVGGNASESPEASFQVVLDATPPQVVSMDPGPFSAIVPGAVNALSVTLDEPVVTSVRPDLLTLVRRENGTTVPGSVSLDETRRTLALTTEAPLVEGEYRVTLAGGLADAAGNVRGEPFSWDFATGPAPRVVDIHPPTHWVNVGGRLEEIRFGFDQPLLADSAANFRFTVTRLSEAGPFVPFGPVDVQVSPDRRVFTLWTEGSFPSGYYRVTGTGPNVQDVFYEFRFRNVGNEWIPGPGGGGIWKYAPGPGINDELLINAPGAGPSDLRAQNLVSLIAYSDLSLFNQTIQVLRPIETFGALTLNGVRFGAGETRAHGPVSMAGLFGGNYLADLGPHTLHAHGGVTLRGHLHFSRPEGALVNHPGSRLDLITGTTVQPIGSDPAANSGGRILNLGTMRSLGEGAASLLRLEGVRLRNDGDLSVPQGGLLTVNLENNGWIDVAEGSRMVFAHRSRSGVSSRLTGAGTIEFGEYNTSSRRVVYAADADFRGDVITTGPLVFMAGKVTLWRPLVRPDGAVDVRNGSRLNLLAPSRIGSVILNSGSLSCNADSEIDRLQISLGSTIEASGITRVTGDNLVRGGDFIGAGTIEFTGTTTVSNGTQQAVIRLEKVTLVNRGVWRLSGSSSSGTFMGGSFTEPAVFENRGEVITTTARPVQIQVPFVNRGTVRLRTQLVEFDGRGSFSRSGVYRPEPGADLILDGTTFDHGQAGTLELRAGVLGGIGSVWAVNTTTQPKIVNRAVLRLGSPTGTLTLRASAGFEQTGEGEMVVTLGAAESSRLTLTQTTASLAGRLRVELAAGYQPVVGTTVTILTCTGRSGEFDEVLLPDPGPGVRLELVYANTSVSVRAVAR